MAQRRPADARAGPRRPGARRVNVHRIVRRTTTYGAPYDPEEQDDDTARGLVFIFIGANAMATLEFLQQEWIDNGSFMSHGIETFNVLRGGEYFFLPSLPALRRLADPGEP